MNQCKHEASAAAVKSKLERWNAPRGPGVGVRRRIALRVLRTKEVESCVPLYVDVDAVTIQDCLIKRLSFELRIVT